MSSISMVRLRHGCNLSRWSRQVPQRFWGRRCASTHIPAPHAPLRIAVVGSGPAGFYTAYRVMSKVENCIVDMYERLPVPFGLVRFGVAPDHPEVKNCQNKFTEVASSPNFNFIGNIEIGKDVSLRTLADRYNVILFAYGASQDRKLGIPGEESLAGICSANNFVGWYNGAPEYAGLDPDLSLGDTAVIIGQGNVSLDVARILLTDVDALRKTDITDRALSTLTKNRVKRVHIVGRRGPMQVAFTIKEARELMQLPSVAFEGITPEELPPLDYKLPRTARRMVSLLRQGSAASPSIAPKSWSLDFLKSPQRFLGDENGLLHSIEFAENQYKHPNEKFEPKTQVTLSTSAPLRTIKASLAFRSIGYKSVPIGGMPENGISFDVDKGIIRNDGLGRIIRQSSEHDALSGYYCAGWVKRGPTGVIANTMEDSFSTADAIIDDWHDHKPLLQGEGGWDGLAKEVITKGVRPINWTDWTEIDRAEQERGRMAGKEREKLTNVTDMLDVLR